MIVLHHCVNARSFRALWTLEELGLEYELRMEPFPPRERSAGYLEINPLGTVPTLFDGALRMTESAAICQYLVARHGPTPLDVRPEEEAFGAYLNWLHLGEATLTFPLTIVLRYSRFEAPERRLVQAVDDYKRWFLSRLRTLTAALAEGDYVCAGRFTAADVSVGYALMLATELDLSERFNPAVADYWARLQARDGFVRAQRRQEAAAVGAGLPAVGAARAARG